MSVAPLAPAVAARLAVADMLADKAGRLLATVEASPEAMAVAACGAFRATRAALAAYQVGSAAAALEVPQMCAEALPAEDAASPSHLPMIESPRAQSPDLLEHAAAAIEGCCVFDSQGLAAELRGIAAALRPECPP
jgi:hypothetical protein